MLYLLTVLSWRLDDGMILIASETLWWFDFDINWNCIAAPGPTFSNLGKWKHLLLVFRRVCVDCAKVGREGQMCDGSHPCSVSSVTPAPALPIAHPAHCPSCPPAHLLAPQIYVCQLASQSSSNYFFLTTTKNIWLLMLRKMVCRQIVRKINRTDCFFALISLGQIVRRQIVRTALIRYCC